MAAEDYTIIDLSSTINTKKRSCIVISSDDEGRPVADDDDLIILDSKRPKNTALDVEIIDESCTFNDKHDFRYHFNLESLMTTAKEFYDHSNKINSSQNNHTDHLLALQLQAEDDVIFCTRTIDPTRSEVRITKITTPEPKNDTTIPSSTTQAPQINVELPSTVSRPTIPRNTTCTCTTTTTTTTATTTATNTTITSRKKSKGKSRRSTKKSQHTKSILPPNAKGKTVIGKYAKSSLSINSYVHLGADCPPVKFVTSSSLDIVESGLPAWWKSPPEKLYHLSEVPLTDNEAIVIIFPLNGCNFNVIKLERIECPNLWRRYMSEVKLLAQSRGDGFDMNEKILYHCSRAPKDKICSEGLDTRLSNNGLFGRGIYFSDIPSKCDGYVGGPEKLMYACKVILGCVKVYPKSRSDPQLTREPPKKHPLGSYYDSVKGHMSVADEYIIYNNYRCVPLYVITYS